MQFGNTIAEQMAYNTSLDRSAGSVFFNLFGAAKVVADRRAGQL